MAGERPLFVQAVKDQNPDKRIEVWLQDEMRFGQQGTKTPVWGLTGSRPSHQAQARSKRLPDMQVHEGQGELMKGEGGAELVLLGDSVVLPLNHHRNGGFL